MQRSLASILALSLLFSACIPVTEPTVIETSSSASGAPEDVSAGSIFPDFIIEGASAEIPGTFGSSVTYKAPTTQPTTGIAADFAVSEAANTEEILASYGITLTPAEKTQFAQRKFLLKKLPDTTILPRLATEHGREFLGLYTAISGGNEKERTQANSLYWSSDIFLHSFSLLEVELIKEMENTVFAPAMRTLTKVFFQSANEKLAAATSDTEKTKWRKIRNYFAVPHALFQTSIQPLDKNSYTGSNGNMLDPEAVKSSFKEKDTAADTEQKASALVQSWDLDRESETEILKDLHQVFAAEEKGKPEIFLKEFEEYMEKTDVEFFVDFTQFTPRSHYTSSSLRRQYFRGMNWFIQIPFFVGSDALTDYAFGISQMLAEHPEHMKSYNLLEATINFLVGTSDDLMPVDYLTALEETKSAADPEKAIREYLFKARQPKIKSLTAAYPTIGDKESADVTALTKGMRFFSGKFILDSYWTDMLTQGDEANLPGYTQKLPPMASSLEVMGLLGSDYARSQIIKLDFYKPEHSQAIDQMMRELTEETGKLTEDDWRENAYTSALWVVKGLFSWEQENRAKLPRYMQHPDWQAKTLMTASAFWTELRHTVLLYAKQSFAERGGGSPCDDRKVPEPPKAYIEPQLLAYKRLQYLAKRIHTGLNDLGFTLQNFSPLESYISAMDTVIAYTEKELTNTKFTETVVEHRDQVPDHGECVWYEITSSDWEALRRKLVFSIEAALPIPVEGITLPAKDKRAAIIADVHTGGDSLNPTRILYEATGVPHVILVAVKDTNGPRTVIGFTYAHHEFTEPYGGQRLTDEKWQEKFYIGTEDFNPFQYTPKNTWPAINSWYLPLFPAQ